MFLELDTHVATCMATEMDRHTWAEYRGEDSKKIPNADGYYMRLRDGKEMWMDKHRFEKLFNRVEVPA